MHTRSVPDRARAVTLRVRRWGRRYAVVLPDDLAEELGLLEGSLVEARVRKRRPE